MRKEKERKNHMLNEQHEGRGKLAGILKAYTTSNCKQWSSPPAPIVCTNVDACKIWCN